MIEKWDRVLKYAELCKASEVNTRTMTPEERLKYGPVNKEAKMGRTPGSKNKQKLSDTERELQEAAKPKKCRICGKAAAEGSDKCAKCASYDKPEAPAPVVSVMPTPTEMAAKAAYICDKCGDFVDPGDFNFLKKLCVNCDYDQIPVHVCKKCCREIRGTSYNHHSGLCWICDNEMVQAYDQAAAEQTPEPVVQDEPEWEVIDEMVDHPKHYNVGKFEVIDVIEDWGLGFNLGNAVKYIARCDFKDNALQDLKKAAWYLNREISRRER